MWVDSTQLGAYASHLLLHFYTSEVDIAHFGVDFTQFFEFVG